MSFRLVEDLQKKACPKVAVSQACRILGVSRSGYYANVATLKQRLAAPLVCSASVHLKAAFAASHKAYGSRRLTTLMAERGQAMGRHKVRTLMRLNGLRPVWRRKCVHTTDSLHNMAVSANVLNRRFEQALPNRVWVCDITPAFAGAGSTFAREAVGCTWRQCWTCTREKLWAGRWPLPCLRH